MNILRVAVIAALRNQYKKASRNYNGKLARMGIQRMTRKEGCIRTSTSQQKDGRIPWFCHWMVPPWRIMRVGLHYKAKTVSIRLLDWETHRKSRYRRLSTMKSNQGTTKERILRWETEQKYRNKVYQGGFSLWEARKKSRWKNPMKYTD